MKPRGTSSSASASAKAALPQRSRKAPSLPSPAWEEKHFGGLSRAQVFEHGKKYAQGNEASPARCAFMRVAMLCSCNRGLKREPCKCKDFEKAAARSPPDIFNEAMYSCRCSVGKRFQKCDDALHIGSLSYMVAVLLQKADLERAAADAKWLLEIAPRSLEGYLRLGQVSMKNKNYLFAWQIYTAAINMGRANGLTQDPKYTNLVKLRQPLHVKFCKVDPIVLPPELLYDIMSHLVAYDWYNLLRTSKAWHRWITGNPHLWRHVFLTKNKKLSPKQTTFDQLVKYSRGDVRLLHILPTIPLTPKYTMLLQKLSPRLEELHIRTSNCALQEDARIDKTLPALNLRRLALRFVDDTPRVAGHKLVELTAKSLVAANLIQYGMSSPIELPALDNLQDLVLGSSNKNTICLNQLSRSAPHLRRLWLDTSSIVYEPFGEDPGQAHPDGIFSSLECLILNRVFIDETAVSMLRPVFPRLKIFHMRVKDYMSNATRVTYSLLYSAKPLPENSFARIQEFGPLTPKLLHGGTNAPAPGLEAALRAGSVTSATIEIRSTDGNMCEKMDGFRGTALWGQPSIRSLVLMYTPMSYRAVNSTDWDDALVPFLNAFPNLETVVIHHDEPAEREVHAKAAIAEAVICRVGRVRTVYEAQVQGAASDLLGELARKHGKRLLRFADNLDFPAPPVVTHHREPGRYVFPVLTRPGLPCVFW
ncbi:hypothetical protein BROUX41_006102 [Berkeleyomyces rouxiae]